MEHKGISVNGDVTQMFVEATAHQTKHVEWKDGPQSKEVKLSPEPQGAAGWEEGVQKEKEPTRGLLQQSRQKRQSIN